MQLFSFNLIGFPQDQREGMRCWWMGTHRMHE